MALTNGTNLGVLVNGDIDEEHYLDLMKQWRALDGLIQCNVKDKDLTAPPGSPANGDCYIPAAGATGPWATHSGKIARYYTVGSGAPLWEFFTPKAGWSARVLDEVVGGVPALYVHSGSAWIKLSGTASGADIVSSSTDTTAGRLLTVGYHGLGGQSIPNDNWDTIVTTGFYHNTSSGATGIPIASVAITCIHIETSTNASQFAMRTGSVEVWKRQRVSGVWGVWIEFWTSSNLTKVSSVTDTTSGRMLTTGYAGLLSDAAPIVYGGDTVDLNSRNTLSWSRVGAAANIPAFGSGAVGGVLTLPVLNSGRLVQLAVFPSTGPNILAMRTANAGVYEPWVNVWNETTLVKTSSATDKTAARIPKVGDVGSITYVETAGAFIGDVFDLPPVTAEFRVTSITTNLPVALNGYVEQIYRSASQKSLVFRTDGNETYEIKMSTTWGTWKRIYSTMNTSANVQTMLAAADNAAIRTAIGVAEVTTGTFTPVIEGSSTAGVGTYSVQVGRYQRVGNTVHCVIHLAWSAHTGTGTTRIAGLPFTAANVTNNIRAVTIYADGMPFTSGNTLQGMIQNNVAYININERTPAGPIANHNVDAAVTGLRMSFTYEV